jgi:hypothetical protein
MVPKNDPSPGFEQLDLWGAFAASLEQDQATKHQAKARQRRGSRKP